MTAALADSRAAHPTTVIYLGSETLRRRTLACFATLALVAACAGNRDVPSTQEAESHAWGAVSGGLRCRIRPVSTEFTLGERWSLNCTVEDTAECSAAVYLKDIKHFWTAEVEGPKVSKRQLPPGPGPATDSGFVELAPGESFSFEWSPSRGNGAHSWSLGARGSYKVSVV
jgi:hypothetical protein